MLTHDLTPFYQLNYRHHHSELGSLPESVKQQLQLAYSVDFLTNIHESNLIAKYLHLRISLAAVHFLHFQLMPCVCFPMHVVDDLIRRAIYCSKGINV